jgi:hypothetical protein
MAKKIEIYIRDSGDRTYLNFYIPEALKEHLIDAVQTGSFSDDGVEVNLEVAVLPKWITDQVQKRNAELVNQSVHVRIPVDMINFQISE